MIRYKVTATLIIMVVILAGLAIAADSDSNILKNSGSLERLLKNSGVYNASRTGKTPSFVIDPSWPQTLPNNWLLGQVGGLYVDQHDHVWIYRDGDIPGLCRKRLWTSALRPLSHPAK